MHLERSLAHSYGQEAREAKTAEEIRDPKATQKKSALIARTSLNIRSRLTHLPKCTYIGTVQP